ncbi:MAG: penicillin acylase family protein [Candidatus Eremiobacteraeota bacterium]|nr:penicillin acylase family protein [Candidatus Eremiobacteraeota bacterium]
MDLRAPVTIARDERGIPHIKAQNEHDLFFADGYVEGSDRLFQMDLIRHFVYGRIAEMFGGAALDSDEEARVVDIPRITQREWNALPQDERDALTAFADGVNAAMQHEPLPFEYRLIALRPERWRPQDSLACGFATVLDLIDSWNDVYTRDFVGKVYGQPGVDGLFPLSDPKYDVPLDPHAPFPLASLPPLAHSGRPFSNDVAATFEAAELGSNNWVAGAAHSLTGHALLASDPHLRLGIPGVWYLIDLHAPGYHVAGASLAGTPGVILGHNDSVAWGATNGTVATETVYEVARLEPDIARDETFHVRFGRDVHRTYHRDANGFEVISGGLHVMVHWNADLEPRSPLTTFDRLDRARSISGALSALATYPGPPQNFVLADATGLAAYHLAGEIPDDPAWGRRIHISTPVAFPNVPFEALPHVDANRNSIAWSSNNVIYGAGYRYRLSPAFAPPYRAYEVRTSLAARDKYSVDDFSQIQVATSSVAERELARDVIAAEGRAAASQSRRERDALAVLAAWDGRLEPDSTGAPLAWELKRAAVARFAGGLFGARNGAAYHATADGSDFVAVLRAVREDARGYVPDDDYDRFLIRAFRDVLAAHPDIEHRTWGDYGDVAVRNPLSNLGVTWLNAPAMQGDGDSYTVRVQADGHSQSFRAVWDVGNWDAGGIVIPEGESGEPGSPHYTDLNADWQANRLIALPYSDAAVARHTRETLLLSP